MTTRADQAVPVDPHILQDVLADISEAPLSTPPPHAAWLDSLVETCLDQRGQEIVRMRVDERLPFREIGRRLGGRSGTWARTHFYRQMDILRDLIEASGGAPYGGSPQG